MILRNTSSSSWKATFGPTNEGNNAEELDLQKQDRLRSSYLA